jgi:hypothetical protein
MAIELTVTTPQGFEATNAYHRIENITIQNKETISFALCAYKDNTQKIAFDTKGMSCKYDITGNNPIAQAYMYLKTLPEFASAKDC